MSFLWLLQMSLIAFVCVCVFFHPFFDELRVCRRCCYLCCFVVVPLCCRCCCFCALLVCSVCWCFFVYYASLFYDCVFCSIVLVCVFLTRFGTCVLFFFFVFFPLFGCRSPCIVVVVVVAVVVVAVVFAVCLFGCRAPVCVRSFFVLCIYCCCC